MGCIRTRNSGCDGLVYVLVYSLCTGVVCKSTPSRLHIYVRASFCLSYPCCAWGGHDVSTVSIFCVFLAIPAFSLLVLFSSCACVLGCVEYALMPRLRLLRWLTFFLAVMNAGTVLRSLFVLLVVVVVPSLFLCFLK